MSWAEIKKAINSDFSTPLNTLITNFLNDSTYGLNAIKTQVVKNQNWYAKYGTTTTLASKTTETKGISSDGKAMSISLLTIDVPEDGMYQWVINGAQAGVSTTAGSYTHNSGTSVNMNVFLQSVGSRYNYGSSSCENNKLSSMMDANFINKVDKNGYVYLQKGERVILRFGYVGNYSSGHYPWMKVASAYLKYIKQTI